MLDLSKKISFGVNLDDVWRYTGRKEPGSIVLPHLLSVELPESSVVEKVEERWLISKGEQQPSDEIGLALEFLTGAISDLGVDFVRCWFPWNFFEPKVLDERQLNEVKTNGYSEYPFDRMVNTLKGKGISVLPVLGCGYTRMLPSGINPDKDPGDYIKRLTIHVTALVRHYMGSIAVWQIENEPNWWEMHSAGGWRSGAVWLEGGSFRFELLKMLNDAVHSEDPSANTMINLEADAGKVDVAFYSNLCDVIGLDFYPNYKSPSPVDASPIQQASMVWKQASKPVMIAETGYPSGPRILGYTESRQAEYIRRACLTATESEGVTAIGIWRLMDSYWRSFPDQENHFGLMDKDGRRKPAFVIYSDTIAEVRRSLGR